MMNLHLGTDASRPLDVLCIGAHADDIEIGCGATLLELARSRPITCHWVVLSAMGVREVEARASAARFLAECSETDVRTSTFRESYFPYLGVDVKDYVQALAAEVSPDLVFTHHGGDRHQDHRIVSELCWNAFRNHLVLEYEVPKYDGRHGSPSVYVPIEPWAMERKLELLREGFPSQSTRYWFSDETFRALMRIRGVEARAPSGYAEAFFAPKVTLSLT